MRESTPQATLPAPPAVVGWLGYGGLLPFALLAAGCAWSPHWRALLLRPLLDYAALILSFVGALHWGLALRVNDGRLAARLYTWSVVPCLWAWLVLQLPLAMPLLAAGFALHWLVDLQLPAAVAAPPWYARLRLRLTLGAIAALLLTWLS